MTVVCVCWRADLTCGCVLQDLEMLMDPSRNMAKYRNLLNSEHIQPPVVSSLRRSPSVDTRQIEQEMSRFVAHRPTAETSLSFWSIPIKSSRLATQAATCVRGSALLMIIIIIMNFDRRSSHGHHGSKRHELAQHAHSCGLHALARTLSLTPTQLQRRCAKRQLSYCRTWQR